MTPAGSETLIRWAPLAPGLHPLPIYGPDGPLHADWIGITKATSFLEGLTRARVSYIVVLASDRCELLGMQQCDTLRIALDQAPVMIGAESIRWHRTNAAVAGDGILPDPRRPVARSRHR